MKRVLFLLHFILIACMSYAQQLTPCAGENGKWGFADEDGQMVIAAIFDDVEPFQGDIAVVQKDSLWGFIDRNSSPLGRGFVYDVITSFGNDGLFKAYYKGKWRLHDVNGVELASHVYDAVSIVHRGVAVVVVGNNKGLINSKGDVLLRPEYDELELGDVVIYGKAYGKPGSTIGMCDYEGHVIIPEGVMQSAYPPSDGVALGMVWDKGNTGRTWALFDTRSQDVTLLPSPQGIRYKAFKNGFSHVVKTQKQQYFIDKTGNQCTPNYEWVGNRNEGCYVVKHEGCYGVIDSMMNIMIPCEYFDGGEIVSEGVWNTMEDDEWGYLNLQGQKAIPFAYEFAQPFSRGYASVGLLADAGVQFGLINHSGEVIVPVQYANIAYMPEKNGKMNSVWVATDTLLFRYDLQTHVFSYKPGFGTVTFDADGNCIVRQGDMWGVVNSEGKTRIPVRVGSEKVARSILAKTSNKTGQLTEGEIYRMSIYESEERNERLISDRIPKYLWDY